MSNAWIPVSDGEHLPTIPADASSSADVLVLVEYTDGGGRDWLKGRMVRRWQVPTPERCTILAWQPGPELPKEKKR